MKTERVTKMAVNMEQIMPALKVTANPLMGPVPNWNNTTAAMKVVIFASTMVRKALEKPESIAALTVLPILTSSRILSNISTLASMAMPTVRMIPAIPGKVKAAPK